MPYRIAGIDVHKKILAVVVADVEVDVDFHFERQKVGTSAGRFTLAWPIGWSSTRWTRSSWSRPRSIGGRCGRHSNNIGAPRAARARRRAIVSRARSILPKRNRIVDSGGRKKDFPDAERSGETPRRAGAHLELCAGRGAAALAHRDAAQIPGHAEPRAASQPAGGAARGSAHQGVQPRIGPARHQCAPHAPGAGRRRNHPAVLAMLGTARLRATPEQLCDAFHACPDTASGVPSSAEAHARRIARDRGSPRPTRSADGRPAHGFTTTRCSASPRSPDSASIPHSRSSRGRRDRRDLPLIEASRIVDGRLSLANSQCAANVPEQTGSAVIRPSPYVARSHRTEHAAAFERSTPAKIGPAPLPTRDTRHAALGV